MAATTFELVILNTGDDQQDALPDVEHYLQSVFRKEIKVNRQLKTVPNLLDYYEEPRYHVSCEIASPNNCDTIWDVAYDWCCDSSSREFPNYDRWLACDHNQFQEALNNSHSLFGSTFSVGTLIGLNTFVSHFTWNQVLPSLCKWCCHVNFEHDKKCLNLMFNINGDNSGKHSLMVPYASIRRILMIVEDKNASQVTVALVLSQPAMLHCVTESSWQGVSTERKACLEIGSAKIHLNDVFGMCTVLKFSIQEQSLAWSALRSLIQFCPSADVYISPLKTVSRREEENPQFKLPCFGCSYAFQSVISRSFEVSDQIAVWNLSQHVQEIFDAWSSDNHEALEKALFEIQLAMDRNNIVLFARALGKLYQNYCQTDEAQCGCIHSQIVPEGMTRIRKVFVTPTRTICLQPQPYLKSRMLRHFEEEYALKVSVRDDNLLKLGSSMARKDVYDAIREKLLRGIQIGDRKFTVLGCSTSQLRSNSMWYYAVSDSKGRCAKDIRKEIGNFEHIKNVPKYLARVGMTLSQSQVSIVVPQSLTNVDDPEDDIERNNYVFSDGIGKISQSLVEKLNEKFKNSVIIMEPCAFQIRYAGCKGMLVLDPNLASGQIVFRKSMQKFKSKSDTLEILKVSQPRPVYLNRPLITILDQMGVPKDVFLMLQMKTLKRLCYGLIYDEYAVPLLKQYCKLSFPFEKLSEAGVQLTSEPFFRSMLYAITMKIIDELKMKARIPVPLQYGRTMFGVLDETGKLQYGEVFVQHTTVTEDGNIERKILKDTTVLVTRNPCMHPGDVRKLKARDVPELHHIYDCIVFPQRGPRPHPDEMSGGDLDGDEFVVIWMEDLIFSRDHYAPMHFPNAEAEALGRPFEDEDLINFLCEYIKSDYVGIFGHAHLGFADMLTDGIFSETCVELARKYTVNLDFVKSGLCQPPNKDEWLYRYPDFMEKQDTKSTYVSQRVLGDLYRRCSLLERGMISSEGGVEILPHPTADYPGWEEYETSAKKAFLNYKGMISSLLKMYGIEDEAKLISGAFLKNQRYLLERNDDSDSRDILELQVREVFDKMKDSFFNFSDFSQDEFVLSEDLLPADSPVLDRAFKKVTAWYVVSHNANYANDTDKKFWGFPWVVADVILRMKREWGNAAASNPLIAKIDEHILSMLPNRELSSKEDKIFKAIDVLFNWTYRQKDLLYAWKETDFKQLKGHLSSVFLNVVDPLEQVEDYAEHIFKKRKLVLDDEEFSPGRTIIDCLQSLAMLYFSRPPKQKENMQYELGLLAVFTLHRTAATGKLKYLCPEDGPGTSIASSPVTIPSVSLTERLRVDCSNEFAQWASQNPDALTEAVKRRTGVEEVVIQVRNLKSGAKYLYIFARGNCWVLQRLKTTVIQSRFASDIQNLASKSSSVRR